MEDRIKALYQRIADYRASQEARQDAPTQTRLRRIREDLRLSQHQFAQALGVPAKTLQGWEQGRPVPKPVFILAELIRDFAGVRMKLLPPGWRGRLGWPRG